MPGTSAFEERWKDALNRSPGLFRSTKHFRFERAFSLRVLVPSSVASGGCMPGAPLRGSRMLRDLDVKRAPWISARISPDGGSGRSLTKELGKYHSKRLRQCRLAAAVSGILPPVYSHRDEDRSLRTGFSFLTAYEGTPPHADADGIRSGTLGSQLVGLVLKTVRRTAAFRAWVWSPQALKLDGSKPGA